MTKLLSGVAAREKAKAFKLLAENNKKAVQDKLTRSKRAAFLTNKLKVACQAKSKITLESLRHAKAALADQERSRQNTLSAFYEKLRQAQASKKEFSLASLRSAAQRKQQLIASLLRNLRRNKRTLLKHVLDSLARHSTRASAISSAKNNAKKRVIPTLF